MNNTKSIVAMILAFIVPIAGLILAVMAKKEDPNDSLAKAAFIISLIFTILGVLSTIGWVLLAILGAVAGSM